MDLISSAVNVYGVPGFKVIGYDDWARQRRDEIDQGLPQSVSYDGLPVTSMSPSNALLLS